MEESTIFTLFWNSCFGQEMGKTQKERDGCALNKYLRNKYLSDFYLWDISCSYLFDDRFELELTIYRAEYCGLNKGGGSSGVGTVLIKLVPRE